MSDLRTEIFTKVLPKMQSLTKLNFDDPEQPEIPITPAHPEKISNNEHIFNWVKEHPACYGPSVAEAFGVLNTNLDFAIDKQSVLTQLYVMAERKLLHKVKCSTTGKYMYSVAVDVYPRAVRAEVIAKMRAAREAIGRDEMARRIARGHKANRQAEAETKLEPTRKQIVLVKKSTGEQVSPPLAVTVTPVDLNTLSIVQARKLYDELKQIFGA